MKKFALLAAAFICLNASAQIGKTKRNWVKVDDQNSVADYYIDPASIVRQIDLQRVFVMSDLKISSLKYKSTIAEVVIKCGLNDDNKFYSTYAESYSENVLEGVLVEGGKHPNTGTLEDVYGSYISIAKSVCRR